MSARLRTATCDAAYDVSEVSCPFITFYSPLFPLCTKQIKFFRVWTRAGQDVNYGKVVKLETDLVRASVQGVLVAHFPQITKQPLSFLRQLFGISVTVDC